MCGRRSSLSLLDDLGEAPALGLRQRTRLDDAHGVTDPGLVRLVVGVELDRAPDDLLVARVQLGHIDLDDDRLVGLVGDDDAAALLPGGAVAVRTRDANDRLAALRLVALRLAPLPPLGAGNVLLGALLLRGYGRGFRRHFCGRHSF